MSDHSADDFTRKPFLQCCPGWDSRESSATSGNNHSQKSASTESCEEPVNPPANKKYRPCRERERYREKLLRYLLQNHEEKIAKVLQTYSEDFRNQFRKRGYKDEHKKSFVKIVKDADRTFKELLLDGGVLENPRDLNGKHLGELLMKAEHKDPHITLFEERIKAFKCGQDKYDAQQRLEHHHLVLKYIFENFPIFSLFDCKNQLSTQSTSKDYVLQRDPQAHLKLFYEQKREFEMKLDKRKKLDKEETKTQNGGRPDTLRGTKRKNEERLNGISGDKLFGELVDCFLDRDEQDLDEIGLCASFASDKGAVSNRAPAQQLPADQTQGVVANFFPAHAQNQPMALEESDDAANVSSSLVQPHQQSGRLEKCFVDYWFNQSGGALLDHHGQNLDETGPDTASSANQDVLANPAPTQQLPANQSKGVIADFSLPQLQQEPQTVQQINNAMIKLPSSVHLQQHRQFVWDNHEDYAQACTMFVQSFMVAYLPFTKKELGIEDTRSFLTETIKEELDLVKRHPENTRWLIAKEGAQVIGLLILDLTKYPDQVYGRQMAVTPSCLHQNVGTQMALVAREAFPGIKKFTAITRVINITSMKFFESLGLKKSSFMHDDYDSNKYVGFEFHDD